MKLSFPSIAQITEALTKVGKRFPIVVLVSLVGTITAIWLTDLSFASQEEYPRLLAVCFVSGLGISFLFALTIFLEQKGWVGISKLAVKGFGLILLLAYYFLLGDNFLEGPNETWYRFFLFALGSHLLVSFSPFISSGKLDQFWEYNKSLFLRILLSVLYSGVLFVGLSIALLAIDNLLELNVDGETYMQLFLFLGGIFNTWFFLAGVPEKEEIQTKSIIFPTGLRVFVQYVLIPLVSVYIFILYLYVGKILIQWELPNGWASNLVLSFSIAGILSLLLLYPIRNSKEFKWVSFYSKYYYIVLIPLIGLLMFSIWVRISEYGVTINRYFVATLGVWLTGIVIYFILSKSKSIKVIPISLCIIILAVSFGPLGAFAVSERSQFGRFEEVLNINGMLDENNQIIPKKEGQEVTFEDRKELSSIVYFIIENHGPNGFTHYFDEEYNDKIDSVDSANDLLEVMNIGFVNSWENENSNYIVNTNFEFSFGGNEMISISDYDLMVSSIQFWNSKEEEKINYEGEVWYLLNKKESSELILTQLNKRNDIVIPYFQLKNDLIMKYKNQVKTVSFSDMSIVVENEKFKVLCLFTLISGEKEISKLNLDLYIKIKQ